MSVAPARGSAAFAAPGGCAVRVLDTAAGRMIVEATPRGIARLDQVGPEVGLDEAGLNEAGLNQAATWFDVEHYVRAT